jgi:DNA-binding response OmpR family regulator
VNVEARRVKKGEAEVTLTAKEFDLLLLFIRNPDRAFTREEIYSRIWGDDLYVDPSNIAVHIRRLREKIEDDPSQPCHVETVWGVGYRWKPEASSG